MEYIKGEFNFNNDFELYDDGFSILTNAELDVSLQYDGKPILIDEFMNGKIIYGEQKRTHENKYQAVNTISSLIDIVNETLDEIYENMNTSIDENSYFSCL